MKNETKKIEAWLSELDATLSAEDWDGAAALFGETCYWRDLVLLSWNIVTVEGRRGIAEMLANVVPGAALSDWQLSGSGRQVEDWIEAEFTVGTRVARGRGHVRLKDGRAWTMVTSMTELRNRPWAEGLNRPKGAEHGAMPGRLGWAAARQEVDAGIGRDDDPHVLIIGGGQAGMALGARLDSLGLSYLILEKNAQAGDNWRNRYESLCLHDPVWYDHMPYIPFPEGWPIFTPKDRMGDWLEMYAKAMALTYWTSACAKSARREGGRWEVNVNRAGEEVLLRPRELVFATGMSGYAYVPKIDGADDFAGRQIHSSEFRSGLDHSGARAVVIGANTSAHDICHDLWEQDVPVTMIQRSSTLVARSANVVETLLGPLYSEDALAAGITTEQADFLATTWPWAVVTERAKPLAAKMAAQDADLHTRLRVAGFQLDNGWDGSGIPLKSARQGGGFYIDVGASDLIANGEIGLVSGQDIARISADAVVMADGTRLPCDLIVYATGFGSMSEFVRDVCGDALVAQAGRVWGLGSDTPKDPGPWQGELRNMWKPTAVDGLWFHGGNLAQSRHYSALLAMQLAARADGRAEGAFSDLGKSNWD